MTALVVVLCAAVTLLAVLVFGLLRSHALILRALEELGAGLDLERDAADAERAEREHGRGHSHEGEPGGEHGHREHGHGEHGHREHGHRAHGHGEHGSVPLTFGAGVVPATRPSHPHAADIVGVDLEGREVSVRVGDPSGTTLLAFLSSGCSVCHTFWHAFADPDGLDVPAGARLVVVAQGPHNESVSALRRLAGAGPGGLELVLSDSGWSDYEIPGSPYFVHVERGRITGEGSSTTWQQVADLMRQGVADIAEARGGRDDLPRMDRELLAAGIHPGHASLYAAPDVTPEGPPAPLPGEPVGARSDVLTTPDGGAARPAP